MDDYIVNPDVTSALTSAKSVLAIVNGLTLTNTLLILITGGHYSHVIPLGKLGVANVIFAVVLMANIVRFYHGNVRHLDAAYGVESIARAASGRHVEPRGGMGLDFFIIFTQSLLFSITSFYILSHSSYMMLFTVLLAFDVVWTVYSQQGDGTFSASPQRMWLLNNIVALMVIVVFYLVVYTRNPTQSWALYTALGVIAATTVVDFGLNWSFYFPRRTKDWCPGEAVKVFLSAPLTQYVNAKNHKKLDGFRAHWGHIADALERSGHQVFSAHRRESWGAKLDTPESALKADVAGLHESELVIAYIGNPPSPGVQLELGYAIAGHKQMLVFIDHAQDEPYLVKGLGSLPHSEVIEIEGLASIKQVLARKGLINVPEPAP
jgi:nucleoside 2-deoxyribosyltransferase